MRKTSAMVEAGILAAIAVVMALIAMYVPVIGAFVNFVWPLPVVICGVRHGFKWSLMTLIVAALIIAMVLSPMQAFFMAAIFGILGLILGECMHRHLPPMKMMFFGSLGGILALVTNIALSYLVLDIDPINTIFSDFSASLTEVAEFQRSHGIAEADIQASIAQYKEMLRMMRIIMPAAFLMCAPLMAFVNFVAAKKILSKLGETFEDFPPFTKMVVPGYVLWLFLISLLGVTYFYLKFPESWMYKAFVNVQTVCSFLLVFQGIVDIYWYVQEHNKPKWWANLAVGLMFLIPILPQLVVYIGAFDIVMDWRKLRK